jgi:hypothetical protein
MHHRHVTVHVCTISIPWNFPMHHAPRPRARACLHGFHLVEFTPEAIDIKGILKIKGSLVHLKDYYAYFTFSQPRGVNHTKLNLSPLNGFVQCLS